MVVASLGVFSSAVALCGAQSEDTEPELEKALEREFFQAGPWDVDLGVSQAVKVGNMIIVSGVGARGPDLKSQLKTIYIRAQSIMGTYGATMGDVVQERVMMLDLDAFEAVADVRKRYYRERRFPATTFVEVKGFLDSSQLIQIEFVAVAD